MDHGRAVAFPHVNGASVTSGEDVVNFGSVGVNFGSASGTVVRYLASTDRKALSTPARSLLISPTIDPTGLVFSVTK